MIRTLLDLVLSPDPIAAVERAAADLPRVRRCLRMVKLLDRMVPAVTLAPETRAQLGGYLFEDGPLLVSLLAREAAADPDLFAELAPDDAAAADPDPLDPPDPIDGAAAAAPGPTRSRPSLADVLRGRQTRAEGWLILHRVLTRLAAQAHVLYMVEQSLAVRTTLDILRTVRERARGDRFGRVRAVDQDRADAVGLVEEMLRRWQEKKRGKDGARRSGSSKQT